MSTTTGLGFGFGLGFGLGGALGFEAEVLAPVVVVGEALDAVDDALVVVVVVVVVVVDPAPLF